MHRAFDLMNNISWVALLSASLLGLFFVLEHVLPLRSRRRSLWQRIVINAVVSGLALAAGAWLVRPGVASVMQLSPGQVGLLGWVRWPAALEGFIAFALMDLSFYYWHRLNHQLPWLWRFHNVHHIDPDLDVSTAFRFHFGEVALSAVFRIAQVALIGIEPWAYLVYEAVFQANTLFHHSNLRLPIAVEGWLNRLLVTPRMHGIHHSQFKHETNSNYSVVFPWWDWLHKTMRLNVPQSKVVIGVPAYNLASDNRLDNLLLMPFRQQRDYWCSNGHQFVERDPQELDGHASHLAD